MSVQKKTYTSRLYREKTGAKASPQLLELRKSQLDAYSKITGALKASPKTVPEIAKETGMEPKVVFWFISTYYKYNVVSVAGKTEDGYYRYALRPKE